MRPALALGAAASAATLWMQVTEIEKLHRELIGSECKAGLQEFEITGCNGIQRVFLR